MSLTLEWGIEFASNRDCLDGTAFIPMPNEETANDRCLDGQHVVFRYVGDWKRADA